MKAIWMACAVAATAAVLAGKALADTSSGTAFMVAPDRLITNQHVVDGCDKIEVIANDGRRHALVIASDTNSDLAVLRTTNLKGSSAVLRNPRTVRLGESVMIFGFPLSGGLSSGGNFTSGLVSALRGWRDKAGELQITAPVQPGNSGGPLLDSSGLVIGVVQSKLNAQKVQAIIGDIPQNVNFAISLEVVASFLARHNVPFRDRTNAPTLDTAGVAELAQSFTFRIECETAARQNATVRPPPPAAPSESTQRLTASQLASSSSAVARALQQALEYHRIGQAAVWNDPLSGESGTVTPVRTFQANNGQPCREFRYEVQSGRVRVAQGQACRGADGEWR